MRTILKKIALMFPGVRQVKADLHNRRRLAEEYEAANEILVEKNKDLVEQLKAMKIQMTKILELKKSATEAESGLAAKAEHFQSQLSILTAKYERLELEYEEIDAEICHLRLANDDLIKTNSSLASKNYGNENTVREVKSEDAPKSSPKAA